MQRVIYGPCVYNSFRSLPMSQEIFACTTISKKLLLYVFFWCAFRLWERNEIYFKNYFKWNTIASSLKWNCALTPISPLMALQELKQYTQIISVLCVCKIKCHNAIFRSFPFLWVRTHNASLQLRIGPVEEERGTDTVRLALHHRKITFILDFSS